MFVRWLKCASVFFVTAVGSDVFAEFALPSLAPGTQYRVAFVTNGTRDAVSSNIADYNSFVTSEANLSPVLSGLGTTWTALASTVAVDARDNTNTNPGVSTGVAIYRGDGVLIANNNSDLWDFSLNSSMSIDQYGGSQSVFAWTGSNADGTEGGRALGRSGNLRQGSSISVGSSWMDSRNLLGSDSGSLYAISDVLVFTAVPEPSSFLGAVSLGVVGLIHHRRRRRSIR
jgi:hypothetical protein